MRYFFSLFVLTCALYGQVFRQPGSSTPGAGTTISITQVTGLSAELAARPQKGDTYEYSKAAAIGADGKITSVSGDSDYCVHVDGSSAPCFESASSYDPTAVDSVTWSDGTQASITDTKAVTGTDPVWTYSDGSADLTTGTLKQGGSAVLVESDLNAGTDIGADLEEETHASEHKHGGADEVATATPGANSIPKAGAGGTLAVGWVPAMVGDSGSGGTAGLAPAPGPGDASNCLKGDGTYGACGISGDPLGPDTVGTSELDDGSDTPLVGEFVRVDGSDTAQFQYSTAAQVLSDIGAAAAAHNHDASYAALAHDHASAYAAIDHAHASDYAAIDHNHDETYAALAHDHDADYSAIGHDHTGVYQAALGYTAENSANKNAANGYAGLGADTKVARSQIPAMVGDSGAGGQAGAVPAPGVGDSSKCLKGDASWGTCGSGSALDLYDEGGLVQAAISKLNFVGSAVGCVWNAGQSRVDCTVSGGSGTGAVGAVTVASDPTYSGERVATAGVGVTVTDNGADSTLVIAIDPVYTATQSGDNNLSGNNQLGMGAKYLDVTVPNASTTGTTTGKLAGWTTANPIKAVLHSTSTPAKAIGICVSGCGTTGSARLAVKGRAGCVFDSVPTAGNWVLPSDATAGNCKDGGNGSSRPANAIGTVYTSTVSGGTYEVILF